MFYLKKDPAKYGENGELIVKKLSIHRWWRIINWSGIVILTMMTTTSILSFFGMNEWNRSKWAVVLCVFAAIVAYAGYNVLLGENTEQDKERMSAGLNLIAPLTVLLNLRTIILVLMEAINLITGLIGVRLLRTEYWHLGSAWAVGLVLAVVLTISIRREKDSSDENLGAIRKPSSRNVVSRKGRIGDLEIDFEEEEFKR